MNLGTRGKEKPELSSSGQTPSEHPFIVSMRLACADLDQAASLQDDAFRSSGIPSEQGLSGGRMATPRWITGAFRRT
jgi:hypothetical protein